MNWKLLLGRFFYHFELQLLKTNIRFVTKNYPYDRNWIFDAKKILNSDVAVIVDAGANIGSVSTELNYWFPDAKIFAFEPVARTFATLKSNVNKLSNIQPYQLGLGDTQQKISINLNPENTINSIKSDFNNLENIEREEITIITLNDFLTESGIKDVDILKIDVEGFEFEVLYGCKHFLQSIKLIILEVGFERESTKVHFSDVDNFMEKNEFQLCGIYETRRSLTDKRKLWYANNMYVQKKLLT
ncbi:2-O-methyltransferase NoeI [compost metagenome]